ncbi:ROK family transcriptional regulator [Bacillus sp. FSL K6-3431]|uniref:ROK family transcriptional regulator n=1 Tax=Bacillus sp. FSL K6-3431 TaxID=2921500 RepID=UPI0030F812A8
MDKEFTTPKSMKKVIPRAIRTTLLQLESATKVEISQHLDISFPTVSKVIAQMEKEGEVYEVGLDDSSGGRRAQRYTYNPDYMLGLALFLEEDKTVYTIFNCVGEVKEKGTEVVMVQDDLDSLTELIKKTILTFPKISSIAIGVPGAVDNGRIFYIPNYEGFHEFDLKDYYEDLFSIPVVVENDMNAAVLGFHIMNKRVENQSLVYVYSGKNGPGAGILINGDVVRGSTFFTGEISFVPLYDDRNLLQALEQRDKKSMEKIRMSRELEIQALGRLIASFVAIINPHEIIFSKEEMNEITLDRVAIETAQYVPKEHLPRLVLSNWKEDYLNGLQHLALDRMITNN